MKRSLLLFVALLMCAPAFAQKPNAKKWKMIWQEEFNSRQINDKYWTKIPRGTAHWDRFMTNDPDLIQFEDGNLVLIGKVNPDSAADTSQYITGGLYSIGKFSFQYGRIDIRAKVQSATGAWPALWLLPDVKSRKYPDQGEIDIMEHLNYDDFVYQTIHSNYTVTHGIKDNPPHSGTGKINRDGYNTYSVEWTPTCITSLINGVVTFEYNKLNDPEALAKGHWPFDEPFYIVLSQQLGGPGTWVGEINNKDLPVKMWIDYIKVYQEK